MVIAIDFNGVIEDHKHPVEGKKLGPPMPGAIDALQTLYDHHHIIIHTTMANTPSGRQAVADWLEFYDVDYHEIVGKPAASFYVDDNALKFYDWTKTLKNLGEE